MTETDPGAGKVPFTASRVDGVSVVTLAGELDLANAPALRELLQDEISAHDLPVVLDLAAVSFMDSTALGVLVRVRRLLRAEDRALRVACPTGPILRLLTITGLVEALGVHDSLAGAISSITEPPAH